MFKNKFLIVLFIVSNFTNQLHADWSFCKKIMAASGALVSCYYLYKFIDFLCYEDDAAFLKNSVFLLDKIDQIYSEQIETLHNRSCSKDELAELLAEYVLDNYDAKSYLHQLNSDLYALKSRLSWKSRNVDQSKYDVLQIELCKKKLLIAKNNLTKLQRYLDKDYLDLYIMDRCFNYKYAAELDGKITVKRITRLVLLSKCRANGFSRLWLNYANMVEVDINKISLLLDKVSSISLLSRRVKALHYNLNMILAIVKSDSRYINQKKEYDYQQMLKMQQQVDNIYNKAYHQGLADGIYIAT